MDILLYGTPKSWQREMERQGFDPMEKSTNQVVEFMERIEATEDFEENPKPKTKNGSGKKSNGSKNSSKKEPGELLYCSLHGKGNHSTDECKSIQKEVKRLKTDRAGNSSGSGKSTNKTWSKKANDEKKKARSDMNAFIQKEVAKGIKKGVKQLAAFEKKRKSDDSDSDSDLNAFLGKDSIEDFSYSDMDNLKIDSDDEGIDL